MSETPKGRIVALSVWLHVAIPDTHYSTTHTYTLTLGPELCVCFTPTPHAHTLDCSAAENVFLISSPFSLFHSFLPSFLPICDHLGDFLMLKILKLPLLSFASLYRGHWRSCQYVEVKYLASWMLCRCTHDNTRLGKLYREGCVVSKSSHPPLGPIWHAGAR